ncbi:FumA C-terminus/TtdB family hydratase beta subunit [Desulfurivibrio alkaliphilus]|uniref:Hydro-lyase, Fe-S type, tartrate/fumarate subfamily, beta subunit n=1 Tax=Desulfurivibrio alkaliphilus (strain DSM 19089 / UNIQEM U267 / AHT2) TaxID=589865 RepID=D6Z2X2_DESAT|nr:hydro-lyase, Fe-S type, tartrate/fumarate subfamily, beta subunit [Desulfurivibrio alkaliphilus AHT 2]
MPKISPVSQFLQQLRRVEVPFNPAVVAELKAGELVSLSGVLYTGRDQTHRRLCALLDEGRPLPVDLRGQLLYYVGPTPALPGRVIGAAGPTTSYRMDAYTPRLLELGLTATMGKGPRSEEVRQAMLAHGAIYLATIGGAGALLSRCIRKSELVAFADAGAEAMFRFEVENFPAVVINDLAGNDFYRRVSDHGAPHLAAISPA